MGSPVAGPVSTQSVQRRGSGTGHLSLSFYLVNTNKGPLKGLDYVGTSLRESHQSPFFSQRPYQRIFIHVCPLNLLGVLACQYHGPTQHIQVFLGEERS